MDNHLIATLLLFYYATERAGGENGRFLRRGYESSVLGGYLAGSQKARGIFFVGTHAHARARAHALGTRIAPNILLVVKNWRYLSFTDGAGNVNEMMDNVDTHACRQTKFKHSP